ncbi:hypothetical protein DICVIV_08484 [Dictyocaulus viviparus]|uniref:Uncharacterized protein n=1 Tax=Dictyocaulus viviparus TaxID=29172 RepID=A0A0D8XSX4_DICVI|nr:hypothetical protein DICVIV_08484 [Dictyocaulus viviparus]
MNQLKSKINIKGKESVTNILKNINRLAKPGTENDWAELLAPTFNASTMGQEGYSLTEFAHRLAQSEAKYGKEVSEIIECFAKSRVDLPLKRLEDISRARMKCARHLLKIDIKKEEYINLWKLCNIYSTAAVDVDNAMREIRNVLRKRLNTKDTTREMSSFRRLIDEYRPSRKSVDNQEIYDKPNINTKEKQRWLELNMFGRRREEKKNAVIDNHNARKSKAAPKHDDQYKSSTMNVLFSANEGSESNSTGSVLESSQKIDAMKFAPTECSFSSFVTSHPTYSPPIGPHVTKTSSRTQNDECNMVWLLTDLQKGHIRPYSSAKSSKLAELENHDASSLFLKDTHQIANSSNLDQMSSLKPQTSLNGFIENAMLQPIAPPRLNALRAKTTSEVPNRGGHTYCVLGAIESTKTETTTDMMLSHTMIEIVPWRGRASNIIDKKIEVATSQ